MCACAEVVIFWGVVAHWGVSLRRVYRTIRIMAEVEKDKEKLRIRFELTKEQLQERCSDEHLTDISKFVSWDDVGPYLVSRQDMKDIRKDGKYEQDRRGLLIEKWEDSGSEATYDAMITAMLKAKKRKEAEDVFKLLRPERT